MKNFLFYLAALPILFACTAAFDPESVPDAAQGQISRVEPPCWWTSMKTPLQLMVYGDNISEWSVRLEGLSGVKAGSVHTADNPDYVFVDVQIGPGAQTGTAWLVFSKEGESFKYPYEILQRSEGSASRSSFTTKDAIYLIMPDRFSNGDKSNDNTEDTEEKADYEAFFGRHGGDLKGIEDHLDYIAELGMTAIWCTPLLEDNQPESSYHGYACTDYYNIDSRFGGNEEYLRMVQAAHRKGLKVIMDIVPNHCGDRHWWYGNAPFEDWYHVWPEYMHSNCCFSVQNDPYASDKDLAEMEGGWFDSSMVDMNLDNPYLLQYFKQWGVWWMEYAGLDGMRVDTYPYNEKYPMSQWCAAIRNEYPNINIVGEVWSVNVPGVAYWQAGNPNIDGFDSNLPSIMDFKLQSAICRGFNEENVNWDEGMVRIYDTISDDIYIHDTQNLMIFPGNHDTDRIADVLNGDKDKMKMVMALMATLRGYPQIFAGDELMQRSRDLSQGHGGLRVEFPDNWAQDPQMKEIHDYASALLNWRKGASEVHDGSTIHFLRRDNTYAYFRYDKEAVAFVYLNNRSEAIELPWSDYQEFTAAGARRRGAGSAALVNGVDVVSGKNINFGETVTVPAHSALVVEFK